MENMFVKSNFLDIFIEKLYDVNNFLLKSLFLQNVVIFSEAISEVSFST